MKAALECIIAMAIGFQAVPVAAQEHARPPQDPVCLIIDEARDTFSLQDRQAALLLVARQFELAGREVVANECAERYALSHVRLGNTITVILAGPRDEREGRASDMDDLPALYNQIVRGILTGSSVGAMNVVDRTNVTVAQSQPKRVHVDSFGYARLGYGSVLGEGGSGAPVMGFGYRAELDSFGLDISFLNQHLPASSGRASGSGSGMAGSLLRLEALYFTNPRANASAYLGGGVSWGTTFASSLSSANSYSSWSGSGLQGELTAGYELPRASELRVFVQADAALPFYRTIRQTVTYSQIQSSTVTTGSRYNPSIALSVGIGWQRRRH